jgi:RNA polymerase subunit RPABC4/transcription elongation factor Spt4
MDILGAVGSALAGFLGSPIVQVILYAMAVYLVVLWLASAYWVFRDMQQRTENAILPYLAASFIIVFLPIFPLAIFVYKIVRPHEKIGEVYERNLAEEALLAEVEAIKSCPTCARRVDDEWIICPTCRTRLNRVCPNCSRLVGLDWSLCAWCGKDFERPRTALGAPPAGRPAPITSLPLGDEPGRLGNVASDGSSRTARGVAEATLNDGSSLPSSAARSVGRVRSGAQRSARTAPDVLPEG